MKWVQYLEVGFGVVGTGGRELARDDGRKGREQARRSHCRQYLPWNALGLAPGSLPRLITPCPPRPAVSPRHGVPPLHPLMPTSFERWTIW